MQWSGHGSFPCPQIAQQEEMVEHPSSHGLFRVDRGRTEHYSDRPGAFKIAAAMTSVRPDDQIIPGVKILWRPFCAANPQRTESTRNNPRLGITWIIPHAA